jgi:hypothetical protein
LQELVKVHELALGATECEVTFTVGLDTCNRVATDNQRGRLIPQKPLRFLCLFDLRPMSAKWMWKAMKKKYCVGQKLSSGKVRFRQLS